MATKNGRHVFTPEERSLGGQRRAALPDFPDLCFMGFDAICEKHGKKAALAIIHKRSGKRKKGQSVG